MDTEQGIDHSELEQEEHSPDDFERLTALMDDKGSLPPHTNADDQPEESADAKPENTEPKAEEPKEPEPQGQPELEEVEYEGKKYSIPPELKGALLRQADYTRKTQEVATERAAAQQERQTAQGLMQQAAMFSDQIAAIRHIDSQLQQLQQVDWAQLQATDPIKNLELRTAYGELLRNRDGAMAQLNAARHYAQQAELQAHVRALNEGNQVLAKEIPNWGDETQKALLDVALNAGYRKEELSALTDPRAVKILHRLHVAEAKVRDYEAKRDLTQKRVQQAPPKPVRSSAAHEAPESPAAAKEIARLRKTGRDEDAIAALMRLPIG